MAQMLRVTQTGSTIGRTQDQRATVRTLGLRRIRHTVIQPDRPEIRGMIRKVSHLVTFEEISAAEAEAFRAGVEAGRTPRAVPAGPRAKHVARDAWRAAAEARRPVKAERGAPVVDTDADVDASDDDAPVKKTAAKKTATKKTTAKKTAAKKAPATKTAAKKTATKKTAAKKAPAKKTAAKKTAAKKSTTKKSEG
jgi:ribosomal protein L30